MSSIPHPDSSASVQSGLSRILAPALFAVVVLLASTLLFLVQPMIAKALLPRFGGSAAVWTTCLVVFQLLLLAGYLYGDLVARRVAPHRQPWVHGALLGIGVVVVAVVGVDPAGFGPGAGALGAHPAASLVLLLGATVALPYFVLSTTTPMLQSWMGHVAPGVRAYRLYALSNAGSIAALLAFPLLLEPHVSTGTLATAWSIAFVAFACAAIGVGLLCAARLRTPGVPDIHSVAEPVESFGWGRQARWAALSATGSLLLVSVSAHLTLQIAPAPFLWTLPLAIYLLTFILCFERDGWYRRGPIRIAALVAIGAMGLGMYMRIESSLSVTAGTMPLTQAVIVYGAGLFATCMLCHGELAADRPASRPTRFYLMLALGGAIGGLIGALGAPLVFDGALELPIALAAASAILFGISGTWGRRACTVLVAVVGTIIVLGERHVAVNTIERSRDFHGIVRVSETRDADGHTWRWLAHGPIVHGGQRVDAPTLPVTYYSPESGLGVALEALRASRTGSLDIGAIGLGVGTLAAYGRDGDRITFYELDPRILSVAQRRFDYLSSSRARIEHRIGDGRLALTEDRDRRYDLIVVDAFSGDAVPAHLLTAEAMALYRQRLKDDGVLMLHVSNLYLDLEPVAAALAAADGAGWRSLWHAPSDARGPVKASAWVAITRDVPLLERLPPMAAPRSGSRAPVLWTDDRNALIEVLK